MCMPLRPVAISVVCASNKAIQQPISTAWTCRIGGNGALSLAATACTFAMDAGTKPISTIPMISPAMKT